MCRSWWLEVVTRASKPIEADQMWRLEQADGTIEKRESTIHFEIKQTGAPLPSEPRPVGAPGP